VQQARESYANGRFSEAARTWQLAAKAFQSQEDIVNHAQALNNLSLAYQQLGLYSDANQVIINSVNSLQAEKLENISKEQLQVLAQALNIQGQLHLVLGRIEKALATWQESAAVYNQVGDHLGIVGSLLNQAQALQKLGFNRQAVKTLNSVNDHLNSTPNTLLKVASLRSLGNTLRMVGELNSSQQLLQQSLRLAQQLKSSSDISATLLSLGNTARVQQDTKAALDFYQQAAKSKDPATQLQARLNLLRLLLDTKQVNTAQSLVAQIRSQLSQLPANHTTIYAQINFAQSLIRLGQVTPADARQLALAIQKAQELEDRQAHAYALGTLGAMYEQNKQWSEAQNLTQQALILAQSLDAPNITYRFSWQLGRLLKAQGDLQGAIASYTEAVNSLKSLRHDLVAINSDMQFNFRDEVEPVYRELVALLLHSQDNFQPGQKNLVQARDVIESLQLAELNNFFRAACLEGKPIQIDQVVDRDDPSAAVIYPIILAERLEVILKLPGQPLRHYQTKIAQDELEKRIMQLRQLLTKEYMLPKAHSSSKQIYDWLLRPAETDLVAHKVKTLVFVMDGVLRNIPMAAIYDGQQYVIEKYAVVMTSGLQLLPPHSIRQVKLKALTAGLTEARQGFAALDNVKRELAQIESKVPSAVLLNQTFTSAALESKINSDPFSIVHLATHGQFSSQADKTFVVAWDKPIGVNELNSLLEVRSDQVNNSIELLVLSACETATGDSRAVLGLAGVAVRAGARSTVASLWSIDDESTALFMGQFYQELTQSKRNKAEALRQAQLALLQSPNYAHPRYWSAYVLVGNWL